MPFGLTVALSVAEVWVTELAPETDPQTSGGLLVACAPDAAAAVLAVFRREGFERAGIIGECVAGHPRVQVDYEPMPTFTQPPQDKG